MRFKKNLYLFTAVLLMVCIFASFAYAYNEAAAYSSVNTPLTPNLSYSQYDDTIANAEQTIKEYEQRAAEVQAEIDALNTEYENILAYIEDLDKKYSDLTLQVHQISDKLGELEEEKAKTEEELAIAVKDMDEQYEVMSARIKYVYENGETSYWDILLNSASIADMLNRVEYVSEISEYDDNLLANYQRTVKRVKEYNDMLEYQLAELDSVKNLYDMNLAYAESIREAKTEALEECAEKIGVRQDIYAEYMVEIESGRMTIEEATRAKEEEEKRLREQQQNDKPVDGLKGTGTGTVTDVPQSDNTSVDGMIWPLPGYGNVSSPYGYREGEFHKGTDIPAPMGTPIIAALAGTAYVGYSASQGNYVIIDHGNGVETLYYHMSAHAISSGYVMQGQVIGYVGNTGWSYGNHLHFGVRVNGEYKNGLNYVAY